MLEPLQILVSVTGVSLVVFLVWLATRRATPVVIGGESGARAWIAREFPGFAVGSVAVDVGDRRALAVSKDNREAALIFVMGRRVVGWRRPASKLGSVEVRKSDGGTALVALATGDFTRPGFSLELADPSPIQGLLHTQGGRT